MSQGRPEVWFYHLQARPLEQVLPLLLERSLDRGWRCAVQAVTPERLRFLDDLLWTYADESFLPHGVAAEGDAAEQPVYLTLEPGNPGGAQARFLVEGAEAKPALDEAPQDYERVVILFDGNDDEQLAGARAQWKVLKALGLPVTYWQQGDSGRWEKKA